MGRKSSVGIATHYALEGPGIESRWRQDFSGPCQTGPGAYPASCSMRPGSVPGVKWTGHGVDHSPISRTEVEERVELYLYSLLGLRGLF